MAYASAQFALSARQDDGATLRQHLMMAHQARGIMPQQLQDEPVLPEMIGYLWQWFVDLHEARGSNGFGANCITWRDILDWQQVTGNRLAAWEVRAIRAVDRTYLEQANKHD